MPAQYEAKLSSTFPSLVGARPAQSNMGVGWCQWRRAVYALGPLAVADRRWAGRAGRMSARSHRAASAGPFDEYGDGDRPTGSASSTTGAEKARLSPFTTGRGHSRALSHPTGLAPDARKCAFLHSWRPSRRYTIRS